VIDFVIGGTQRRRRRESDSCRKTERVEFDNVQDVLLAQEEELLSLQLYKDRF